MNGIFIVCEYRGKLVNRIVCNSESRWFMGKDSEHTYPTVEELMARIDEVATDEEPDEATRAAVRKAAKNPRS